jgi:aspartyl-tRNA synthetase
MEPLRTRYAGELSAKDAGKKVTVAGWVHNLRDLKAVKFLVLRDKTGTIQVVANKDTPRDIFDLFSTLGQEDIVSVTGTVVASKAAVGYELAPSSMEIVAKSRQPLPLDPAEKTPASLETRLDSRFMDVRRKKITEIFVLESELLAEARKFFRDNGFVEFISPKIVGAGAEGGATLFPIKYYDKEAFLSQSPQLYKQAMMASGLDRVFEITPAFRAEKSNTIRHLSEFISVDCELSFIRDEEDVMEVMEGLIKSLVKRTGEIMPEAKLPRIEQRFPRLTCEEGSKILGKAGIGDFSSEEEKKLGAIMAEKGHDFFFITKYPSEAKPFYIMVEEDRPEISRGFDLEFDGMEVTSGGQREHRPDVLEARIKGLGLDQVDFETYLHAFRYGMPPHGGFGFGIARFIQMILKLDNIREAVLFPRDQNRLVP